MIPKIRIRHVVLLIAGIGFLLYAHSFSYDYTNFDDNSLIQDNQSYISNFSNVSDAFKKTVFITGSDVFYRPIETVWFILNAQLAGKETWKELPAVFHISGLLLHLFAVFLIFILFRRFNKSIETSLFLSLLFLVHPLLTQAVAWVPGVVDILVTVFSICAFLFFLDFIKSGKRKYYVLHILFFALALYTKETAVGIMIICTVYYFLIRTPAKSLKEGFEGLKVFFIGWFVVCVVWFMMRSAALQNQHGKEIGAIIFSLAENLPAFIQYIGKILLPFNLSVMPVMKDTSFVFGIITLIILSAFVFISKEKRKNWIWFSIVWFVVFLLPTFIRTSEFRVQQFYEHRMYLPMIGILFLVSETDWLKNFSIQKISHRIIGTVTITFLFILTFRYEKTFSDTKSFLDNAISTAQNSSLAHRNMGIHWQDQADKPENKSKRNKILSDALSEYQKALALNPNEKDLHNNMGVIYDSRGKKDLAEKEYLAETQLNPGNSQSWHNLGVLTAERNENEKAESYFKKAIGINPLASTYQQLALLYKKMGRKKDFENIIALLQQNEKNGKGTERTFPSSAKSIQPSDPISLGLQLMQQGKPKDAEQVFKKLLERDSLNKSAYFNLALIHYSEKNLPLAETEWRKALQIDSTYTDAYNNLAICMAQQGKNADAEKVLKKLISSNPNYIDGYFNIANFYARSGKDKEALFYLNELKKLGVTKEQFQQRGIKLSAELEKLFDK